MSNTQKNASNLDRSVMTAAVLGSLVLVNVLGLNIFTRVDLTRDNQYTLSAASRATVGRLNQPVTVRAYFSKDLPGEAGANARYVADLLDEYYVAGDGMFRYEFIDPVLEETEADKETKKDVKMDIFGRQVREKTSIELELEAAGIPAVQLQVREEDNVELKKVYMGLAIDYGDQKDAIPVVQDTAGLEYDLTSLIRKMTRSKTPKVAFVRGEGSLDPQADFGRLYSLLTQNYDVAAVDLTVESEIAEDVDAIIVLGPTTPFSDAAQRAIDAFVMTGKSAAFMVDSVKPELQTLQSSDADHGLSAMLATYGVTIEEGLVLDVECAMLNVQQQRGWMRVMQPVKYPYMPIARAEDPQHPLTRGLDQLAFPFMNPLTVAAGADSGVTADILIKSSAESWVATPPYNLDPMQRWTADNVGTQQANNLLISLTGSIKSHFSDPTAEGGTADSGRILVGGGSAMLTDQFMSAQSQVLVLNLLDWLVLDEAMLAVRSRGLTAAPIDDELTDGAKAAIKYGNIVGVPAAFIALGLIRWRRRESRRQSVSL